MGNLVWRDLSRSISLTASIYAVWASFWGMLFRKFFWDFIGGILRNPGGIQPCPRARLFVTIIVRFPVVQVVTMALGFTMIALEYPLATARRSPVHRSIHLRIVLLTLQSFLAVLFYQGTNACLWSLIAVVCYARALALGERVDDAQADERRCGRVIIRASTSDLPMQPSDIVSALAEKLERADASGERILFPSAVYQHLDIGLEFELRLCAALQKKPVDRNAAGQLSLASESNPGSKRNPFAPPYSPQLYLGELSLQDGDVASHYVVLLNKFSVAPTHFLLVTKEFQSQSSPLLPPDLVQTYLLLLAARRANKHLIAFYNCGPNSGASQPHKHIQLIEVGDDGPPIEKLARKSTLEVAGRPFAISSLPYANHVFRLPSLSASHSVDELRQALFPPFLSLLDLVISTVRHDPDYPSGSPSYNVILTLEHIHLIPRRHEAYKIEETQQLISVNSLGFAGMLLAKSESELESMRKEGIGKILRGVGLESVHELQVAGTSLEAPEDVPPTSHAD